MPFCAIKLCKNYSGKVNNDKRISFHRLIWLLMLILCGLGAVSLLETSLQRFSKGSVSFSVETTYLDWDTPFPGVTVCEAVMERKRISKFLEDNNLPSNLVDFSQQVAYWSADFCKKCINCVINETCLEDIEHMVERIRLTCTEIFLPQCWWGEEPFLCCDRFLPVHTEYGICFVFNSRLLKDESDIIKLNLRTGLKKLTFSAAETINMRFHSPGDVMMTASEDIHNIPLDSENVFILKAEQTISDASVHAIPLGLRDCLMSWERPSFAHNWVHPFYTYDACVWYCRAMAQYRACNCAHHFEPPLTNISKCDVKGLACLALSKKAVADLAKLDCVCPMACEEVDYKIVHAFNSRGAKQGLASKNVIHLAQLPSLRVRRYAIRDTLSFVVDIGGVGGVFFGASVLSVLEIVYLFFLRKV